MEMETTTSKTLTGQQASRSPVANLDSFDVIIIGAGQAGMAAAHRLIFEQQQQCHRQPSSPSSSSSSPPLTPLRLLILEATDHVGGRTRNYDVKTGKYDTISDHVVELGGTWLSPSHTATLELLNQLDLDVYQASFLSNNDDKQEENKDKSVSENGTKDQDDVEFPWWWWGVDYSEQEMKRLQRIVLHVHNIEGGCSAGDASDVTPSSSSNGSGSRRILFSTAQSFLESMDETTLVELDQAGKVINEDCAAIRGQDGFNVWEQPSVGAEWQRLDSVSTAQRFLEPSLKSSPSPMLTSPNARNILRNAIHNKNAQEPEQVSYLYNLISWGGSNSGPGPDTQYRVRGGTQAIPLRIADKLMEEQQQQNYGYRCQITFDSPVTKICHKAQDNGSGGVDVTIQNGQTFHADTAVLVTGSPATIQRNIVFEPSLPKHQSDLLLVDSSSWSTSSDPNNKMPMGCCIKFMAIYKQNGPWWRENNLQGDVLSSYLPPSLSLTIPKYPGSDDPVEYIPIFPYCFDVSPYSQDHGILCCFLEGDFVYKHFHTLDRQQQEELFREFLRLSFENIVDGKMDDADSRPVWEPDAFLIADWGSVAEPFVGGAYTSYFPPGVLSHQRHWEAYRQVKKMPPNVFLAGADYHAGYGNGYIEGAIRSGQAAADSIWERRTSPVTTTRKSKRSLGTLTAAFVVTATALLMMISAPIASEAFVPPSNAGSRLHRPKFTQHQPRIGILRSVGEDGNHSKRRSRKNKHDNKNQSKLLSRWISWMKFGKLAPSSRDASELKMREAEELGGVARSERYSSR